MATRQRCPAAPVAWRCRRRWTGRTAPTLRTACQTALPVPCAASCGRCFTIIWARPGTAHPAADAGRAAAAGHAGPDRPCRHHPEPGLPMNPLVAPEAHGPAATAPRCRSTSTRWPCCATPGTWASPTWWRGRRIAVLQAGAQGITVHPRPDAAPHPHPGRARPGTRCCRQWPAGRVQHRGQPAAQPDGLHPAGAAAPGHLRARQRRPVHLRPRLERLPADAARLQPLIDECPCPGRAGQPVHGPVARGQMAGARATGADRVELYTETYAGRLGHAAARGRAGRLHRRGPGGAGRGPGRQRRP